MNLFAACALTVAVETLFFVLLHWRDRDFLFLCVCANAATNLALNLLLMLLARLGLREMLPWLIYPLELLVVAAEYAVYTVVRGRGVKLFALVFAANAISYCIGLLLFGHV